LRIGTADTLVATLRDGADAVIPLPTKSARVSLRHDPDAGRRAVIPRAQGLTYRCFWGPFDK
jgi:hypothetical protein